MAYIGFFVKIFGLPAQIDESEVEAKLRAAIVAHFDPNDIEIEIDEHSGVICHDSEHVLNKKP